MFDLTASSTSPDRAVMISHVMPGATNFDAAHALRLLQVMACHTPVDLIVCPSQPVSLDAWRSAYAVADRLWTQPRSWLPWKSDPLPAEVRHHRYAVLFATNAATWRLAPGIRARHAIPGSSLERHTERAVAVLEHHLQAQPTPADPRSELSPDKPDLSLAA